jgi:hypothetical protein
MIEETLKSIGWNELYSETLPRILFFRDEFRKYYSVVSITDDELDKCVAYAFGLYGEGMVYNLYSVAKNSIKEELEDCHREVSLSDIFGEFVKAFKDAIPKVAEDISPKNYINLFMEYTYSRVIKGYNTY